MTGTLSFGQAQARLVSLLDDATWGLMQDGPIAVVLTDDPRSAAALGFASLYADEPIKSYAIGNCRFSLMAASRFGALHQTMDDMQSVQDAVRTDQLTLITGSPSGPGPFSDPRVRAFLDSREDADAVLTAALHPLLGADLLQKGAKSP